MATNALTNLVHGAYSLIWGNHEEDQYTPKSSAEVFQEVLSEFSVQPIDKEECIAKCIQAIKITSQPADCDLSETSRELIKFDLDNFNQAVDKTPYLTDDEAADLKAVFRRALCIDVEEKWAGIMAQSFYPILSISNDEEKVIAAQKWTDRYFAGLGYLVKWERGYSAIPGNFVAQLQHKTSIAFHAYCHDRIQNRMKVMQVIAERDPVAFASKMEAMSVKQKENPSALSLAEIDDLECIGNIASCVTMYFPDVDKKMELLKKCIWNGFTLREMGSPILDPVVSQGIFANVFKMV